MIKLGVLDQSPIRSGGTPADAIAESLRLAARAEELGYARYWFAEHHSSEGLAGSTPEILIARIAAQTSAIRVGAGGVMLSHYSSLKVAENFRMLETLYPGRIDLGIGRAPGSDRRTATALKHGPGTLGIEHFPQQVSDLIDFLHGTIGPDHRFAGVKAMPEGPSAPQVWLLGSSDHSAAYAAHFGCAFSFAHFINDRGGAEIVQAYKEYFRPTPRLESPRVNLGVFVVCAEDDATADGLAASRDLWLLDLYRGRERPYPSVEEALAYPYTDDERTLVRLNRRRTIWGTPDQVKARIESLAAEYGVDEIIVVTICHDFGHRMRSYEMLAEAFGLDHS